MKKKCGDCGKKLKSKCVSDLTGKIICIECKIKETNKLRRLH